VLIIRGPKLCYTASGVITLCRWPSRAQVSTCFVCFSQKGVSTHTEKLEKLKASVKLDKDALLCWKEDMARDGENNELLTKYTFEDESKAKVND